MTLTPAFPAAADGTTFETLQDNLLKQIEESIHPKFVEDAQTIARCHVNAIRQEIDQKQFLPSMGTILISSLTSKIKFGTDLPMKTGALFYAYSSISTMSGEYDLDRKNDSRQIIFPKLGLKDFDDAHLYNVAPGEYEISEPLYKSVNSVRSYFEKLLNFQYSVQKALENAGPTASKPQGLGEEELKHTKA